MTQPPGLRAGLALLREPDIARLVAARLVSAFGTAMAPVAMAFGVLEITGSARLVGVVIASQTAAQLAVQLFGGALADRWSRRRQMVGADLLAAAAQCAMAWLLLNPSGEIWPLAVLMAVNGVGFAFHWPAAVGIVPQVAPAEQLQPTNALLSLAQSAAFGLGGACAGIIVAFAGAGWAIAVDAGTFAVSALLIASLRPRDQERSAPSSLLRELREGWREFSSHRWLWAIVLQFSVLVAAWSGGFVIVGPVVAERSLGGAAAWAWVAGAFGAGLLAGGLLAMRITLRRPMFVATWCCFLFALPLLLLAGTAPLGWIAAGAFLAGVGGEMFGVLWNTALHTHVAPEALSRVSAYDIMGSMALAPLGEALAGPLVEWIGAPPTLLLGAALIALPTLAVLGVREVRTLGTTPAAGGGRSPLAR